MGSENTLSVQKAIKVFNEFPQHIQDLARRRFFNGERIYSSKSGKLNPQYHDKATAKEVASAVNVLRAAHPDIRFKWNQRAVKNLFQILCLLCCVSSLLFLAHLLEDSRPDIAKSHDKRVADPDFIEKALGLEDNAIEKILGLADYGIEKFIVSSANSNEKRARNASKKFPQLEN